MYKQYQNIVAVIQIILNDTKKRNAILQYSLVFLIGQSFCANQHFQTRSSLLFSDSTEV